MSIGRSKPLENLQGVGEVFEGNTKLADVDYELSIRQEILIAEDFRSSEEVEVGQSGTGLVYVRVGKINLLDTGKMLTLHMADRRKQDFFIPDGDVKTGRFTIKLSGKSY